jgi:hypothetical protein
LRAFIAEELGVLETSGALHATNLT